MATSEFRYVRIAKARICEKQIPRPRPREARLASGWPQGRRGTLPPPQHAQKRRAPGTPVFAPWPLGLFCCANSGARDDENDVLATASRGAKL